MVSFDTPLPLAIYTTSPQAPQYLKQVKLLRQQSSLGELYHQLNAYQEQEQSELLFPQIADDVFHSPKGLKTANLDIFLLITKRFLEMALSETQLRSLDSRLKWQDNVLFHQYLRSGKLLFYLVLME